MNMRNRRITSLFMLGFIAVAMLLSACGALDSPSASARTPEEAIAQAVRDYLAQQGSPTDQVEVEIEQLEGDFARVKIISADPDDPGGSTGFLARKDGVWTTLITGSGFDPAEIQALGIPESVLPEGWFLITDVDTAAETDCPPPTDANVAFVNAAHGYCLLYPDGYVVEQPNPSETVLVVGSLMNHTDPRVSISVEPASGRSASQAADGLLEGLDMAAFNIERTATAIGGEEAVLLDGIPGQDLNRQLVVVHNGMLYHLFFSPFDPSLGETHARMEELFELVTDSLVFQTPSGEELIDSDQSSSLRLPLYLKSIKALIDKLAAAGASVQASLAEINQPFFTPAGQLVRLNGADLQIFAYDSVEAADAEAALIAPDGGSVGTHMATWMASPHFFKSDQFIVLYVGDDAAVLSLLESALGPQVAGAGDDLGSAGDLPLAGCPSPEEGTLLLTDEDKGYCLLYPASHTVVMLDSGNTEIVVGEIMNHIDPRVSITTEDLAGRSLQQVVDEFLAGYPGFEIEQTQLTVAGENAILLDGIPGQDYYRNVFVAHNDQLYQLQIAPYDKNIVDSLPEAEKLYAIVMDTFQFIGQ